VRYAFTRQFAVGASVTRFSRSGSGTFTAALPHPLYLDHDRSAEGRLEDLHYTESALYLDLVYLARAGKAELSFFAGPTFFRVRASLVDRVDYAHSYPFDSVTVTDVPDSAFEDQAAGWHAGAAVDFHISPRVGLGAQARFTRAQAELAPAAGQNVSLDAGGLQLTAGVRVFF
jgi:hypothetical protein